MSDNVTLVQEAYDGFAQGDVGPLLSILGENIEWYEAEHVTYWPGGAYKGPQAVLEGVISRIPQDFDNFTINIGRTKQRQPSHLGNLATHRLSIYGISKATRSSGGS